MRGCVEVQSARLVVVCFEGKTEAAAALRLGAMEHVGTVVNVAWKWKRTAEPDGTGQAGWPNREPRLRGWLPLPRRRVRVRLPGPWLSPSGILGTESTAVSVSQTILDLNI